MLSLIINPIGTKIITFMVTLVLGMAMTKVEGCELACSKVLIPVVASETAASIESISVYLYVWLMLSKDKAIDR